MSAPRVATLHDLHRLFDGSAAGVALRRATEGVGRGCEEPCLCSDEEQQKVVTRSGAVSGSGEVR